MQRMYAHARAHVADLVVGLSPDELALAVPATPAWTVIDLVAHLAGVTSDVLNGRVDGAGTGEWTARQVAERRGRPVEQLLAEWGADGAEFEPLIGENTRLHSAALDALTHEHDLRGALGFPGPSEPGSVEIALARSIAALGSRLDAAGGPSLRFVGDNGVLVAGSGSVIGEVATTSFEMFRATFGRRGAAQIRSYHWDCDPSPFLAAFSLFGPLPAVDVCEAGAPGAGASRP